MLYIVFGIGYVCRDVGNLWVFIYNVFYIGFIMFCVVMYGGCVLFCCICNAIAPCNIEYISNIDILIFSKKIQVYFPQKIHILIFVIIWYTVKLHKKGWGLVMDFGYFAQPKTLCSYPKPQTPKITILSLHITPNLINTPLSLRILNF